MSTTGDDRAVVVVSVAALADIRRALEDAADAVNGADYLLSQLTPDPEPLDPWERADDG